MSNSPVYIKEVEITDYKCFKGKHKFSFVDENGKWCQWTVLLGNNNTGKTNLLKAIAASGLESDKNLRLKFSSSYGVTRRKSQKRRKYYDTNLLNSANLFDNYDLLNFEDWLLELDYAAKNGNGTSERAANRRNLLKEIIISEVLPEINDIRFTTDEHLDSYIEYQTKDGWHRFEALGYGYQSTLSWMMDFCNKMFDQYPDSPNPFKEPAVLLVDEIDLHLHPHWQRTVIKYLSDIFPRTQFIVTTHSPFVIQSMEKVNLYTLQREDDQVKVNHLGCQSFVGWRIEEILSEVMGLGDDIQTNTYQELMKQFEKAANSEDYKRGKETYDALKGILHPQSVERELIDIRMSQLIPDDKA
jgi:predicted ATP-binding protein involved in virulence